MRKALIIAICLLLLACQRITLHPMPDNYKTDLSQAASYNVQLGLSYLKQGDRPRAKKKLLSALEQDSSSPDVNAAMAYYFEQTKELEQSEKYYLKAIALSSNSGAQLNNYGTFLCRQGLYPKAEPYFLRAVQDEHYVHTGGAYENAGLCALAIPDLDKAMWYFTKALNQDPSRRVSLYELVILKSKKGQEAQALELIQKHPNLAFKDRVFLSLAKDLANKIGKYELAAKYANRLRKMDIRTDKWSK